MTSQFIVAFDLATATGCADGYVDQAKPRLWSWYLDDAGSDRAARLAYLWRFCDTYLTNQKAVLGHPVNELVYELPMNIATIAQMFARKIFVTNENTLATLRGSIGVIEACGAHHGIKTVRGMDIKDARKHLVGQRTFPNGEAKAVTLRAVKALGWNPDNNNESDAAALWSLAAGQANPRLADATRAHLAAKPVEEKTRRAPRNPNRGTLFEDK